MRRLSGLIVFVAICLVAIGGLRSDRVQDWLADSRQPSYAESIATAIATQQSETTDQNAQGLRGLVVLPDDGRDAILDELNAARISIELYVYLLPADEVIDALHDAHERGVRVRVILEQDPFGGGNSNQDAFDRLDAAGIEVRWSGDRFWFTHIKTFVVDGEVAVIMTLNLSWTALTANREFAVVSTNPNDVAEMSALFEADWSGTGYEPTGSIVTSPDNSRAVMNELLGSAESSIEIYAEVVRDATVRKQLIAAVADGVAVRVLVPSEPSPDDLLIYRELAGNGVQIKTMTVHYSHAKAIIIDRTVALVGSQNLTETSLDLNREAGILLDDTANISRLVAFFRSDWEAGVRVR